jgi:hypothetical protein
MRGVGLGVGRGVGTGAGVRTGIGDGVGVRRRCASAAGMRTKSVNKMMIRDFIGERYRLASGAAQTEVPNES